MHFHTYHADRLTIKKKKLVSIIQTLLCKKTLARNTCALAGIPASNNDIIVTKHYNYLHYHLPLLCVYIRNSQLQTHTHTHVHATAAVCSIHSVKITIGVLQACVPIYHRQKGGNGNGRNITRPVQGYTQ